MAVQSSASASAAGQTVTGACGARAARLLLVDDHQLIRDGLSHLLNREADMKVVWQAADAEQALRICSEHRPDLAIVDIELRGLSGIELVKELQRGHFAPPVLFVSMHEERLFVERAMQAGARGYLTKHAATEKVVEAVRRILQGEQYISEHMRSATTRRAPAADGGLVGTLQVLSHRELEVFRLIGQGLRKGEIANRMRRSINTVEAHRSNLKKKLNMNTGKELQRLAFLYSEQQFDGSSGST